MADTLLDSFLDMFKKEFSWTADPDSRRRQCSVSLYARTIGGGFSDHWALHFLWPDYEATYEANDEDGYLIPRWNRGPPEKHPSYDWRVIQQFDINCSPREVNTKARSISDNGNTYILTKRNCHTWCTELAARFSIRLKQPIEKELPSSMSNYIDLGHCVFGGLSSLSSSQEQSTSPADSKEVSTGRLATAAVSFYRNRESLASSSRVAAAAGAMAADGKNVTTKQASGDGASMVATGLAMVASFAFTSFLESLDDSKTPRHANKN